MPADLTADAVVAYLSRLPDDEREELLARVKKSAPAAEAAPAPKPDVDVVLPVSSPEGTPSADTIETPSVQAAPLAEAPVPSVIVSPEVPSFANEEPPREVRPTLNSVDVEVVAEQNERVTKSAPPPLPPGARRSLPTPIMPMPASLIALAASEPPVPLISNAPTNDTSVNVANADQAPAPTVIVVEPPAPAPAPRPSLPELTETLFEAMHELSVFESAVEGASYCLTTLLRLLPSLGGMVHLCDPETRELVAVYTQGPRAERLLNTRITEADPVIVAAVRKRGPLVVEYGDGKPPPARHAFFGDPWSAIIATVFAGGRVLAVIELIDPLDGAPFDDVSQGALAYVTERYADFLQEHGIVLPKLVAPPADLLDAE